MGKTWMMKRTAKSLLKYKQQVIVWTGGGDFEFPRGSKITTEADELEEWLGDPKYFGSHVMIDEAADLYDEIGYHAVNHENIRTLFRKGRHKGLTAYMATQYPNSVPKRNRTNCRECYCFKLGDAESARQVWKDYGCQSLEGVPVHEIILKLPPLKFLHFDPNRPVVTLGSL